MRKIIAWAVAATFFALLIMSACNRDTSSFEPVPSNSRAVLRLSGLGDCEQPQGQAPDFREG
ncbi:MAG TPA: hypothetical protein VM123_16545 [archaeon]|nr:hypothetical protein [archaeon]